MLQDITTIISTVGFPIAASIALAYFVYKTQQDSNARNKEREEKLYQIITDYRQEMKEFEETNAKFISVLAQMQSDISSVRNDVDDIKSVISGGVK